MLENRLVLVLGTWQLILASAALNMKNNQDNEPTLSNYLVLYGTQSYELLQTMLNLAPVVGDWRKVIIANDLLIRAFWENSDYSAVSHELKRRIGATSISEIWACKLFDPPEKLVFDTYPEASITLFDDGIGSYSERNILANSQSPFTDIRGMSICQRHLERCRETYLAYQDYLPTPSYIKKSSIFKTRKEDLLLVIDVIRQETILPSFSSKNVANLHNTVLVLSQCYSEYNFLSWNEELQIYTKIVEKLLSKEMTVIWKEHPRVTKRFFPTMSMTLLSENFIQFAAPHTLPVELFAPDLQLIGCVADASSSLYSLHHLFGIQPYTFTDSMPEWPTHILVTSSGGQQTNDRIPSFEAVNNENTISFSLDSSEDVTLNYSDKQDIIKFDTKLKSPKFMNQLCMCLNDYQKGSISEIDIDELRRVRLKLAVLLLCCPPERLKVIVSDYIGKAAFLFFKKRFFYEPLKPFEEDFFRQIYQKGFSNSIHKKFINFILIGMMYKKPHQLNLEYELEKIPKWFLPRYLEFLFVHVNFLQEEQEPEQCFKHFENISKYLSKISKNSFSDTAIRQAVSKVFVEESNFIPLYFNLKNLKDIMTCRGDAIEYYLSSQGFKIEHQFYERQDENLRRRIRIGILKNHFSPQTETFLTIPAFEYLDRNKFEIILYSLTQLNDPLERYCKHQSEKFFKLPDSLAEQVSFIRSHDLDILLIGTNTTAVTHSITLLSAHRLARIQATLYSSPVTTGLRNIDYYISGKLTEPPKDAQLHYRERLLLLEGSGYCFNYGNEPEATDPKPSRQGIGVPDEAIVFISGANFFKIIPTVRKVWARILASVPQSVLIIYPFSPSWSSSYASKGFTSDFHKILEETGVSTSRLVILDTIPVRKNVLEHIKLADVYLDSIPYTGSFSIADPLEAGIPPIAVDGNTLRSRQGTALLRELGLEELIAVNEESYIDLAIRLGTNQASRDQVIDKIRRRMNQLPRFFNRRDYSSQIGELFENLYYSYLHEHYFEFLNLREINLVVFPDWSQPENILLTMLRDTVQAIAHHPNAAQITLLIDSSGIDPEDADLAVSSVAMNLMMADDAEVYENLELSLIDELSPLQWQALLSQVRGRVVLAAENEGAIAATQADQLPQFTPESLSDAAILEP